MTGASKLDDMMALLAMQPAAVPPPWRWELVLAAADTATISVPERSGSLRSFAWFVPALSVGKALSAVRQSVERRRARELGLQRVGDLPLALQRLPRMPLPASALVKGARAPVLVPLHPIASGANLLFAATVMALRHQQGRPRPPRRWEEVFAYKIAAALLRRWDWRAAGGPR